MPLGDEHGNAGMVSDHRYIRHRLVPQRRGLGADAPDLGEVAGALRLPSLPDQSAEPQRIHRVRVDSQRVPGIDPRQHPARGVAGPVRLEHLP
jgi:hypothetical protein